MATDEVVISQSAVASAPNDYDVKDSERFVPLVVKASFDGSGAGSAYVPVLSIIAPGGFTQAIVPVALPVQGGGSADVTWAPGLGGEQAVSAAATLLNVNVSAAGVTQLVAAVAGQRIRVLQAALMSAGTTAVTLRSAANDLAGPYNLAAATGFVMPQSPAGFWLQTNVNEALNLNNSLAIQVAGVIAYQLV